MKKTIYLLTFLLMGGFTWAQEIPTPENYTLLDTVTGDLDNDGVNELVAAYDTGPEDPINGVSRELIIYKSDNNDWKVWKKSAQALYGSLEGGMMGDPYAYMEINHGILSIYHEGGSSWKWNHTDQYRFQCGDFYLIKYISFSGKPCEYFESAEFNLLSGRLTYSKEYEDCESMDPESGETLSEVFFEKDIQISMENRREKEIKLVSPTHGYEIYVATKP